MLLGARTVNFYVLGSFEAMKEDMVEENYLFYKETFIVRPDMSQSCVYWENGELLKNGPGGKYTEVLESDFS